MPSDPPSSPRDVAEILEALARRLRSDPNFVRAAQAPRAGMTVTPGERVEPVVHEAEEPVLGAVDVLSDDHAVTVTVETHNVDPASVNVSLVGDRLHIGVGEGPKACRRDLPLPAPVDEEKAFATFRNGVLDVVLPRKSG